MILFLLPHRVRRSLSQTRPLAQLINLGGWLLVSMSAFIVAVKLTEDISWGEAGWQVWQTITTVGYGNAPAKTCLGRWETGFFGLFGIAVLGGCITAAMELRSERQAKRRLGKLNNPYSAGYVVFNIPAIDDLIRLIEELRLEEPCVPICLVDSRLSEIPAALEIMGSVHFVRGSLTDQATYEQASAREQKAVIVFPLEPGNPSSDLATKATCDLLQAYLGSDTRLMHVLVSERNSWMFHDIHSRRIGEDMEILAIVQECKDPFTAEAVHTLLCNSEGANPATVQADRLAGITWVELQQYIAACGYSTSASVTLFALVRQEQVNLCPLPTTALATGDQLIVIADNGFDWDGFQRAILKEAGK